MDTDPHSIDLVQHRLRGASGRADVEISETLLVEIKWITDDPAVFLALYRENYSLDFVYDIRSGLFFMGMFGMHQMLMHLLYEIYTSDYHRSTSTAADKYIDRGYGIFRFAVGRTVLHSKAAVIPAGLRLALRRDLEEL